MKLQKYKKGVGYQFKCYKCGYDCGCHYKKGEFKEDYWHSHSFSKSDIDKHRICPCCSNKIAVPGINDFATVMPDKIKYFQGKTFEEKKANASKYLPHSSAKINLECPDCGNIIYDVLVNNIQKGNFACKRCSDGVSYPEKIMISLLEQANVTYRHNTKLSWCNFYNPYKKRMSYGVSDFEIIDKHIIIEVDGDYGHKTEEELFIDKIKDDLAIKNGYTPIRIDCKISDIDYIKSKINESKLGEYIDLSKIDFMICHDFAKTNIKRKAINDYKNGMYAAEIAKKYNVSTTTICNWLKSDNVKIIKNTRKGIPNSKCGKPLFIGEKKYLSLSECERKSYDDFGFHINKDCLSRVLNSGGNSYKGFVCGFL